MEEAGEARPAYLIDFLIVNNMPELPAYIGNTKNSWELKSARQMRCFFDSHKYEKAYLQNNKPYQTKLVPITIAAALLGLSVSETYDVLDKYHVYPNGYKKKSHVYLIQDLVTVSKKIGKPFIIPDGMFVAPSMIYVGSSIRKMARVWHNIRCYWYGSIYDLLCYMGIPAQTMIFSADSVFKLEDAFLKRAGHVLLAYNKTIKNLEGYTPKKIILCTKFGKRELAETLVARYSKRFPGIFLTVDEDHLYKLRQISEDRHNKQKEIEVVQ